MSRRDEARSPRGRVVESLPLQQGQGASRAGPARSSGGTCALLGWLFGSRYLAKTCALLNPPRILAWMREKNPARLKQRWNKVQRPVSHLARAAGSQIQPTPSAQPELKQNHYERNRTLEEKTCVLLNRRSERCPPNLDRNIADMVANSSINSCPG